MLYRVPLAVRPASNYGLTLRLALSDAASLAYLLPLGCGRSPDVHRKDTPNRQSELIELASVTSPSNDICSIVS